MEIHTYGGSRAAEILVDILNSQYPECIRKVGAYWSDYSNMMKEFEYDSDMSVTAKGQLADLFHKHMIETVNNSRMPSKVKSFLCNVMVKRRRSLELTNW